MDGARRMAAPFARIGKDEAPRPSMTLRCGGLFVVPGYSIPNR